MDRVNGTPIVVRPATPDDAPAIADLANDLAQSFVFCRARFVITYAALLNARDACVLTAVEGKQHLGYLLGFEHLTFYANGPVAVVEEILVRPVHRRRGIGRLLMTAFEHWATGHGCALVTLATRRATPFYRALHYEESATYLRKVLADRPSS